MKISIVIVNWNTDLLLFKCIESIFRLDIPYLFEIIIVDNASNDESLNIVFEKYQDIIYIKNDSNLGFATANNQALKIAKGEFILLLNPDTEFIDSTNLSIMITYMNSNPKVGISGCKLIYPNGSWQKSIGHYSTIISGLAEQIGWNHKVHNSKALKKIGKTLSPIFKKNLSHFNENNHLSLIPIDVDFIWGAYFLINRKVIEDIGLLDEIFFIFGEESDFCFRAKKCGWKVQYVPYTSIIHISGQSQKNNVTQMYYWHIAIYFWYFIKHFRVRYIIWIMTTPLIQLFLFFKMKIIGNELLAFVHIRLFKLSFFYKKDDCKKIMFTYWKEIEALNESLKIQNH